MELAPKLLWQNLTPSELDAAIAQAPIAYVPCGSLEWHGEHLPLGCDSFRATEICWRAAAITGGVVLPPIYTTAPGFAARRGTISFSCGLVKALVAELLRELEKVGFRVAVLFLGHGGKAQMESFSEPGEAYEQEHDMRVFVTEGGPLIPPPLRVPGGHAGAGETAQCMAARPDLVDLSRFDPGDVVLPRYEGLDPATYYNGLSESEHERVCRHIARKDTVWQSDLLELATSERGEEQIDAMARGLAEKCKELLKTPTG